MFLEYRSLMGVIAKEEGVLKLVHPGRYVEIHKKPVLAAEVMKKNPRHCITRPDVFENPSIVVNPDSLLTPGKVFFNVPNITLYGLLKARGLHKQPTQQQCQSQKYAGMTGMHQSHGRCLKHHRRMSWNEESSRMQDYNKQQLRIMSWNEVIPCVQDCGSRCRIPSTMAYWPEVIDRNKDIDLEFKDGSVAVQEFQTIASNYEKEYFYDRNNTAEMRTKIDNNLEFDCIQEATTIHFCSRKAGEVTALKSCLRKPDSMRKSLPLRVSFVLPNKDDEQQKRLPGSRLKHELLHNLILGVL